jgi:hypothetical protein
MSTTASFAALEGGGWGVKLSGNIGQATGRVGDEVYVSKRNGGGKHVTLGRQIMAWNAGRAAVYAIARQPGSVAPDKPTGGRREVQVTQPGVYENESGIFIVKPTRDKQRLYAKRLVEINAERATEAGERVQIEFEYAPGAIFDLLPEHKMDLERAKALTIRYGRCIVCNTPLKAAESVERGIGPVCIKSFR